MLLLVEDPHYQSVLVLKNKNESISGYVSYKPGDSKVLDYVQLSNAYIFFETYKRVYVFHVQSVNNLSTNVLVFNKKQSDLIANDIYYEYFEVLQIYFNSSHIEIDEELMDNVLDNLDVIIITAKKSNFLDTLIYRLIRVQDAFGIPPHSIIDNAITRYNATNNDFQISTFLKIAHYLGIDLSILLSDEDLIPHVQIDQNRPPLSDEYIYKIERSIKIKLGDAIRESNLTLSNLSNQTRASLSTFKRILEGSHLPKYATIKNITDFLGIDIKELLIQITNNTSEEMPQSLYDADEDQSQEEDTALRFIGDRIKQAMFLAGFDSKTKLRKVLKVHIDELGKSNPQLKLLLRTSYATRINLSALVNDTKLVRQAEIPEDYLEKARALIIYYIKKRMVELNFSIKDIASLESGLKKDTIRTVLNERRIPGYLLLSQIAEALKTTLPDLLQNLEKDIEQFDSLDLNIEIPASNRNNITENALREFNH